MTPNQIEQYFERIGMRRPEAVDPSTLRRIQEQHIYHVPFENLDIIYGAVPLSLETHDLFDKVVVRRRGGICYELNLLLAEVLEHAGFEVARLSARHPRYGHDFDHAFLMVRIPGESAQWVCDVGFADNFRTALEFKPNSWQGDGRDEYTFRLDPDTDYWQLIRRRNGQESVAYSFTLTRRDPEDYLDRCAWYCTNKGSRFTQGPLVCIERPEGRISLTMNRVLNTFDDKRVRTDIESEEDFAATLKELFDIDLSATASENPRR